MTPDPQPQPDDDMDEYAALLASLTLDELLALLGDCLDDMDEHNATDRYNAEQWARSGTNYNDGWFTGYTVGR